jgi:DNA-binding beta-propeller fold protein YncE
MRTTALSFGLWALGLGAPISATHAQTFTGNPTIDSASVARMAWSAAVRASQARDTVKARQAVERAASAWPTQPTYAWNRAVLAATMRDTAAVERALRGYAAMGLGRSLADTIFNPYRALPWFAGVASAHDSNRVPLARSRVMHTLSDSTLWPEGVDVDARTGNVYVTSVRHGSITEVRPDGRERRVWPAAGMPGIGAALAVRVDVRGDRLWATVSANKQWEGYTPSDSSSALLEIRISDGNVLQRWMLPAGSHVLGDVAIGPEGDVLISDSGEPVLYRLQRGADSLESFRFPLFRSLQGIAPTPKANVVYVADYSHGILRLDLAQRAVTRVADAAATTTLGIDGLSWADGALIAIQNGVMPARVMRLELGASGDTIVAAQVLDRRADAAEPTIGAVVGREFVYVANSSWGQYTADGALRAGARLARPLLLAVPVSGRR